MANNYDGVERRFYKRLNAAIPVEVIFITSEAKEDNIYFEKAYSVNISAGGMALVMDELSKDLIEKLFSGIIRIGLKFTIPNRPIPIMLLAKSAWVTKQKGLKDKKTVTRIGLKFIEITDADRDKIIDFIVNSYLSKE